MDQGGGGGGVEWNGRNGDEEEWREDDMNEEMKN